MHTFWITALTLCLTFTSLQAQTNVFEKEVTESLFRKDRGPNLKKFSHMYLSFGGMALDNEGAKIVYYASNIFTVGYRAKRKLFNFYNLGFDVSLQNVKYELKQDESKIFPTSNVHDREKLVLNNATLEFYQRFNLGKTGNMIGLFIDTGVFGTWTFAGKHVTRDKYADPETISNAKLQITEYRRLAYLNPLIYGIKTRIGYNKIVLFSAYQLNEILDETYLFPELPKLSLGLELSFY